MEFIWENCLLEYNTVADENSISNKHIKITEVSVFEIRLFQRPMKGIIHYYFTTLACLSY